MTAPPRLRIVHPDLDGPIEVAAGVVHLLDDAVAPLVVRTVRGQSRTGGWVAVDGRRLRSGASVAARVRAGLAIVAGSSVAPDVSVHDHVAAIIGNRAATDLLRSVPLLADRQQDPAGVLSGGERRALAWARARATAPRAVLLDGAAEGMDPATLDWATGIVRGWAGDGVAVLVRAGRQEERSWATGDDEHASPNG